MKKILLASELQSTLEREKAFLGSGNLIIFTASSSEEALRIHRAERADLIIADLDIPETGGDGLCDLLRKDDALRNVSVMLVCTNSSSDMERISKCSANTHVTRPIRPAEFMEKVNALLNVPDRKNFRVLTRIAVDRGKNSAAFFCISQNISSTGMLIETEKNMEKGDSLTCTFYLPGSGRIVTAGEVVRVSRNGTQGPSRYGIKFQNLASGTKAEIEAFVKSRLVKSY